jgi:putative membrane protein
MWGYDHMGWMMNGWGMGFGFIFWLVILAVIIAGIVWFVRAQPYSQRSQERRSTGLDVLEERYARGDITREEYLQKKRDVTGQT